MDIVSRLKKFMEDNQIASSQFADTCNIPRPTISQILNGRNKKISDELISKIHTAYPSLSIMWLMFGEGNMAEKSNIEISTPQNTPKLSFDDDDISEHEMFNSENNLFTSNMENSSEKFRSDFGHISAPNSANFANDEVVDDVVEKTIREKADTFKRITNIVVFYDDSTFQTFNPSML